MSDLEVKVIDFEKNYVKVFGLEAKHNSGELHYPATALITLSVWTERPEQTV